MLSNPAYTQSCLPYPTHLYKISLYTTLAPPPTLLTSINRSAILPTTIHLLFSNRSSILPTIAAPPSYPPLPLLTSINRSICSMMAALRDTMNWLMQAMA